MAPEQTNDAQNADKRSDIFSIGKLLTELFTGRLSSAIPDFSGVPSIVERIIRRCTKSNPDDRYQSMTEIKDAWNQFRRVRAESQATEEYEALLEAAMLPGGISQDAARNFFEVLGARRGDGDRLHDALMKISVDAIILAGGDASPIVKSTLISFAQFTANKNYAWEYTDRIAVRLQLIFNEIHDCEVRANLAYCCGLIGANHNRWGVMQKFGSMLKTEKSLDFVFRLCDLLRNIQPSYYLQTLGKYVDLEIIHSDLRSILTEQ